MASRSARENEKHIKGENGMERAEKITEMLNKYYEGRNMTEKGYEQNSADISNNMDEVDRWYEERKARLVEKFVAELGTLENERDGMRKARMLFAVNDTATGRPISTEKADAIALSHELKVGKNLFAITEDGRLIILDSNGEYCVHAQNDVYITVQSEILL